MSALDKLEKLLPGNPLDINDTPLGKQVKKSTTKHNMLGQQFPGIVPSGDDSSTSATIFQQMGAKEDETAGTGSSSGGFDAASAAQEATGDSGDPLTIWSKYLPKGDSEILIGGRPGTTPGQSSGKKVGSSIFVEGGTAGPQGYTYDGGDSGGPVVEKISDMLTYYSKLSQSDPEAFKAFQIKLLQAGAYGSDATTVPDFGVFGPDTRDKLIGFLTSAAQNFAAGNLDSFDEYLDGLVNGQTEQAQAAQANQPAPLVKNYWTDPNNVAAAAQTAAQQLLGKNLSDEQVQQFVNVFHAQEAVANAANNQTSGNVDITSPDLSSAAQGFVAQNNGTDIGAHRMAGYVDQLMSMLRG